MNDATVNCCNNYEEESESERLPGRSRNQNRAESRSIFCAWYKLIGCMCTTARTFSRKGTGSRASSYKFLMRVDDLCARRLGDTNLRGQRGVSADAQY